MAEAEVESPWEDEDKFAVWKLTHVMGHHYSPCAVGVTRSWTPKGLDRIMAHHVKKAQEELAQGGPHVFYQKLAQEHLLYSIEKHVSCPLMTDIRAHLSMMYHWDSPRPFFLIPLSELNKIIKNQLPALKTRKMGGR